ncbi:MAG TPA: hypothetical protein VGF13_00215, partial [Verrucomicrobiae bacterium]
MGIALRRNSVPTKVIEAGRYPRHRVCGEFISGLGIQALTDFQLDGLLEGASRPAIHSAFFTVNQLVAKHRLPSAAITVSRFHLDAVLAEEFCRIG